MLELFHLVRVDIVIRLREDYTSCHLQTSQEPRGKSPPEPDSIAQRSHADSWEENLLRELPVFFSLCSVTLEFICIEQRRAAVIASWLPLPPRITRLSRTGPSQRKALSVQYLICLSRLQNTSCHVGTMNWERERCDRGRGLVTTHMPAHTHAHPLRQPHTHTLTHTLKHACLHSHTHSHKPG